MPRHFYSFALEVNRGGVVLKIVSSSLCGNIVEDLQRCWILLHQIFLILDMMESVLYGVTHTHLKSVHDFLLLLNMSMYVRADLQ